MPTELELLERIAVGVEDIAARDVSVALNGGKAIYNVSGRATTGAGSSGSPGVDSTWTSESVTADATIETRIIGVGARAAAVTVTLPTSLMVDGGAPVTIKDESGQGETFPITIEGEAGELIDGAASAEIASNYGSIGLYPRGGAWHVLWLYGG